MLANKRPLEECHTPPRAVKTSKTVEQSPYLCSPFPGAQSVYTHSGGKGKAVAYSPNGSIVERRDYEGSSHKHVKWKTPSDDVVTYHEHSKIVTVEDIEPVLWVNLLNLRNRINEDNRCILSGNADEKHLKYTTKAIKKLQYLMLDAYLSCENRDVFLFEMNHDYLAQGRIFNPFGAIMLYGKNYNFTLAQSEVDFQNHVGCQSQILVPNIESVIFTQLDELVEKADSDYRNHNKGKTFLAIELADICRKNLSDWYKILPEYEATDFLNRINQHITVSAYNPFRIIELYNNSVYDILKAQDINFFKALVKVEDLNQQPLREKFTYQSVSEKFSHDSSTTIETTTTSHTKTIIHRSHILNSNEYEDIKIVTSEEKEVTVKTTTTQHYLAGSFFMQSSVHPNRLDDRCHTQPTYKL